MLSKKSQTALRLISRRRTKHATIVRRYAPRPVAEVQSSVIVARVAKANVFPTIGYIRLGYDHTYGRHHPVFVHDR
jgi:hypothetical protein